MTQHTHRRRRNKGIALAVVLVMVLVVAIAAAAFLAVAGSDVHLTHREVELTRSFYVAQAGVEKAVAELKVLFSKGKGYSAEEMATIAPPDYDGYTFTTFSVAPVGESYEGTLENGAYKGLSGRVQKIKILVEVVSEHSGEAAYISQEVEAQFIPIFQFAIFYYADDLEILPGPLMTVNGPVHCNSDMYVGGHTGLTFESKVTCAGDIYHGRKDSGEEMESSVDFVDADGVYRDMKNPDGSWLDSTHEDWFTGATERWGGNVASSVHQVKPLRLALSTDDDDSHELIERGSAADPPETKDIKYYHKADLRIIDGQAYTWDGWSVDLTYPDPSDPSKTINPVTTKTFYNFREGKTVSVTEIDVAKLREGGKCPENGILYVSDHRSNASTEDAVRLVNGDQLPGGGLTVVTDNPLYIQGDYNTVDKQPASVMCDAINILSNNWDDGNSKRSLDRRKASDTTVNAAIAAGNTVTQEGQYNGGVENMPRFLEDWSGKTLTYRGSLVALWQSQIATGDWLYGEPHYTAPNRDWGYDKDLADPAKAPPGVTSVFTVEIAHWQYE